MIHEPCPESLAERRIISLDIESTGLSITRNTIIELGVVEIQNGVVVNEYRRLFGGGHSSMYLVRCIHHIGDAERRGRKTFVECAGRIASYLSNATLVTHNGSSFDMPMIQYWLGKAGHSITGSKLVDTLQLVRKMRRLDNSVENEKSAAVSGRNTLKSLCGEFGLQYGGEDGSMSHRGLEDAKACIDLLFRLVNTGKIKAGW